MLGKYKETRGNRVSSDAGSAVGDKIEGGSEEDRVERVEDGPGSVPSGPERSPDSTEVFSASGSPESSRDLLVPMGQAKVSLGAVGVEGDGEVRQKRKGLGSIAP